jgi:hypothetical protein
MPVTSLRWRFVPDLVRETPDQQGVFTLWEGNDCVYIGHTPWNRSLRDLLREHLALQQEGTIDATHFTWEATATPKTREGDLLHVFLHKHGKLPRYNGSGSPLRTAERCITDLRAR